MRRTTRRRIVERVDLELDLPGDLSELIEAVNEITGNGAVDGVDGRYDVIGSSLRLTYEAEYTEGDPERKGSAPPRKAATPKPPPRSQQVADALAPAYVEIDETLPREDCQTCGTSWEACERGARVTRNMAANTAHLRTVLTDPNHRCCQRCASYTKTCHPLKDEAVNLAEQVTVIEKGQPAPPACSDDPQCPEAGKWGATGILAPGHFIAKQMLDVGHRLYLAHDPTLAKEAGAPAATEPTVPPFPTSPPKRATDERNLPELTVENAHRVIQFEGTFYFQPMPHDPKEARTIRQRLHNARKVWAKNGGPEVLFSTKSLKGQRPSLEVTVLHGEKD
jgi:hypothetical protein